MPEINGHTCTECLGYVEGDTCEFCEQCDNIGVYNDTNRNSSTKMR